MEVKDLPVVTIELENVPCSELRTRMQGLKTCLGGFEPTILIKGFFTDKKGNTAFLQYGFHVLNLHKSGPKYFQISVDGGWEDLTPDNGVFAGVRFTTDVNKIGPR